MYDSFDASFLSTQAFVVDRDDVSWTESRWAWYQSHSVGVSHVGDELDEPTQFVSRTASHVSSESSLARSPQSSVVSRFAGEEVLWSQDAKLLHHCAGQWEHLGTGQAMLLKHVASGQVRFFMQDMSSQVLSNFLVYTSQSLCVLKQDTRSGFSCSWWTYHDAMRVHFALVFSSPDLVSKFIEELDAAKLASDSCCDRCVLGHDGWRFRRPG